MKNSVVIEILIWTVILALFFTGLIFLYSKIFVEPNVYTIEFKDIDGITEGSPVRFMGITTGHVRKLETRDKYIKVQIIITKKNMKIPNGTVARVEFYGLGGSKSIELMPPDGSCDVGILTNDTIRIADVAREVTSFVEILEIVEKYIKGLDKTNMAKMLDTVSSFKDDSFKNMQKTMKDVHDSMDKTHFITDKQNEFTKTIKNININVEKVNEFIKK